MQIVNNTTIEQTLLNLDDLRREALLKGDETTIDKLFADELMYIHSSAIVDTKTSYLESLRSGNLSYHAIELQDRQIQILGDIAVMTGIAHMNISINAMPRIADIRYTTAWIKQGQTWQILVFASTSLPTLHPHLPHPMPHAPHQFNL